MAVALAVARTCSPRPPVAGAGARRHRAGVRDDDRGFGANLVGRLPGRRGLAHVGCPSASSSGRTTPRALPSPPRIILRGRYAPVFWTGTVVLGAVAAALAGAFWLGDGSVALAVVAGLLAQVAVLAYETSTSVPARRSRCHES